VPDAPDDRYELPVTVDLLADLQAGLLDDRAATRLRRRVRGDPAAKARLAALDRVRRNLSALAVDSVSAPDVPADVTATIGKALRSAPPPTS
jgi:anti-sigma factor RsiW